VEVVGTRYGESNGEGVGGSGGDRRVKQWRGRWRKWGREKGKATEREIALFLLDMRSGGEEETGKETSLFVSSPL
jgi:hypothetical protein